MKNVFQKLWNDDQGALIAVEWVFVATILVIGTVVGLAAVRTSVNSEATELANGVSAMNQSYSVGGQANHCARASVGGSGANDHNSGHQKTKHSGVPCPANIEDDVCN